MDNSELQERLDRLHAFMETELRHDATSQHAQTLILVMTYAHVQKQTELLQDIRDALRSGRDDGK